MIHMARGLAFLTLGTSRVSELTDDYRKLEKAANDANFVAKEAINRCESLQKKYEKRGQKMKKLEQENEGLVGERDDLARQLKEFEEKFHQSVEKAASDAVVNFKEGEDFRQAVEDALVDKFRDGYEACLAFAEEKGMDCSSIQLSDYADAVAVKENAEEASGEPVANAEADAEVESVVLDHGEETNVVA